MAYVDGACNGNPGVVDVSYYGGALSTTTNRMEL